MDYQRILFFSEMHIGKLPDLYGISVLESQLQDWGLSKKSRSSDHNALDQRSWDCTVKWRTHDISIDCGARRFPWFRYAWCADCVCIEKASQHADTSEREKVSKSSALTTQPILTRNTNFVHDLRVFQAPRACEAVQGLSTLIAYCLQNDDVQYFDVTWDHAQKSVSEMPSDMILEGLYNSKIAEICSTSDCIDFVWSNNCSEPREAELFTNKDSCKTSYWSDDENSKLQDLERCCGKRISHQGSKRKESLRWDDCRRAFSVEGKWTWFQRRLMWCQSRHTSLREQWRRSETKRTIVFSCIPFEGKTDWRRGTKIPIWTRQKRGKLFGQDWNSMPIQILWKICHVSSGILPCVWMTGLKKGVYVATHATSDMLRHKESPKRSRKKWSNRISCYIEGVYKIGLCISRFFFRENLFNLNKENWDQNTPWHLAQNLNLGKKWSIARYCPKVCASWA